LGGLVLAVVLLLPVLAGAAVAEPTRPPQWSLGGLLVPPAVAQEGVVEFVSIALPVGLFRELIGVPVRSVIATPCYDDTLLILPKVVPRGFVRTFMPLANATVLMPDFGNGVLEEGDVLVLPVPILRGGALAGECRWSVYAAKSGLRERYVVRLAQGAAVFSERGLEGLRAPLAIAMYFDRDPGRRPLAYDVPFDKGILLAIGRALGLAAPPPTKVVADFNSPELVEVEAAWSSWAGRLRREVSARVAVLARGLVASYERREEFIYDPIGDRLLAEVESKDVEGAVYGQLREVYPQAVLIDGGGGPSQFYDFVLITLARSRVTYERRSVYLGYNVYSSVLYVRANSSSTSTSYLRVGVSVVDTDTKQVVWSRVYSYSLGAQPTDIYVYPSIPFDPARRFNITVTYEWVGGAQPYVALSTLKAHKIWERMPTEQTVRGYQVLSVGVAPLRDPYSGYLPPGCQRARASDMLDPSVYGLTNMRQGVVLVSPITRLTLDSANMNGLFYDSLYGSSPTLYLDVCVRNPYSTSVSGSITVKVNGVAYATQSIVVYPLPRFGYAGFTVHLDWNPVKGHGHLITIEHNFPPYVELYVDALVEYLYSPEVWRETNYATWYRRPSAWFKLYLPQGYSNAMVYESSIGVEAKAFEQGGDLQTFVLRQLVTSENISNAKVLGASLAIKSASTYPESLPACNVRKVRGTRVDEYVGLATTLVGIVSTGVELATLVGLAVPWPVSVATFSASLVLKVLSLASESVGVAVTPDGYYVCSWSPGINDYKTVELEMVVTYQYRTPDTRYSFVVVANDVWRLRPIEVRIPVYTTEQIDSSLNEHYPGFYGRDPRELVYS